MKPTARRFHRIAGILILALLAAGAVWAQDELSHARIVRLSFVEGTVSVQRPDVPEWAAASVNTPLQEGFRLATGEGGFAEVEFENASTLRLGQQSEVDFTQLALAGNGAKLNRLTLLQGYATVHAFPENEDLYEIQAGPATVKPLEKALFRIDLDQEVLRVEVFKGMVETSSSFGTWDLRKEQVLQLQPGATPADTLSEGITEDAWDDWVDQRESQLAAAGNLPGPPPAFNSVEGIMGYSGGPMYGWNDLGLYGIWSYIPGYGYGWAPNVPVGWMPLSIGHWGWYPGLGWVWISGDPWGWLPYHYGSWGYFNNVGWCWFPSNFGAWSPAAVDWYQGEGWVGWSPRKVTGFACPKGQNCAAAVHVWRFRDGGAVNPGTLLDVEVLKGRPVNQPDVQPGQLARLPGAPVTRVSRTTPPAGAMDSVTTRARTGVEGARATSPGAATTISSWRRPGGRSGVGAPGGNVVYDPVEGSYVNASTAPPAPDTSLSSTTVVRPVYVAPRPVMAPGAGTLAENSGDSSTRAVSPNDMVPQPVAAPSATAPGSFGPPVSSAGPRSVSGPRTSPGAAAPRGFSGNRGESPRAVTPPSSAPRSIPSAGGASHDSGSMGRSSSGGAGAVRSEGGGWSGGARGGAAGEPHAGSSGGANPKH